MFPLRLCPFIGQTLRRPLPPEPIRYPQALLALPLTRRRIQCHNLIPPGTTRSCFARSAQTLRPLPSRLVIPSGPLNRRPTPTRLPPLPHHASRLLLRSTCSLLPKTISIRQSDRPAGTTIKKTSSTGDIPSLSLPFHQPMTHPCTLILPPPQCHPRRRSAGIPTTSNKDCPILLPDGLSPRARDIANPF